MSESKVHIAERVWSTWRHAADNARKPAMTLVFSPAVGRDGLRDVVGEAFDQAWRRDLDDVGDQWVGGGSVSSMGRAVLITISDRRADVRSIVERLCRELEARSLGGLLDAHVTGKVPQVPLEMWLIECRARVSGTPGATASLLPAWDLGSRHSRG